MLVVKVGKVWTAAKVHGNVYLASKRLVKPQSLGAGLLLDRVSSRC